MPLSGRRCGQMVLVLVVVLLVALKEVDAQHFVSASLSWDHVKTHRDMWGEVTGESRGGAGMRVCFRTIFCCCVASRVRWIF